MTSLGWPATATPDASGNWSASVPVPKGFIERYVTVGASCVNARHATTQRYVTKTIEVGNPIIIPPCRAVPGGSRDVPARRRS